MTFVDVYPPITAATVVFALWALVMYRLMKAHPSKEPTLKQGLWAMLNVSAVGSFLLWTGLDAPLVSKFDLFMATLAGIDVAAVLLWMLKSAFFDQESTPRERLLYRFGFTCFALVIVGNMLI